MLPVWSRCGSWRRSHSFSSGTWACAACGWCAHSIGAAAGAPLHQRSASIHATTRKTRQHTSELHHHHCTSTRLHLSSTAAHNNTTRLHTIPLPSSGSSGSGSAGQPVHSHHNNLCRSNRTGKKDEFPKIHKFIDNTYHQIEHKVCQDGSNLFTQYALLNKVCRRKVEQDYCMIFCYTDHALVDDHTHHHVWMPSIHL